MAADSLKILLTDPHLKGGGQVRYVSNLAMALTQMGHSVTIGCKPDSVLVESAAQANCGLLNEFHFRGGLRPRVWSADINRMCAFVRDVQPDIVHVSGSQDHWVAALANRRMGRPVCLVRSRHNTYSVADHLPNRILNQSWTDYQICVCEWVRARLVNQRSFDADRMCAIHNGVDTQLYAPDPEARASARDEFGYTGDHIVCGIAARLVEDKGHRYLIDAVAAIAPKCDTLRLLILGEGPLRSTLEKQVREAGIDSITTFAGFRTDMPRCANAIDIGVQPSIDCDTSSFSLKEIMSAGKPVIASDHGGLPEIIEEGIDGYIVPAGTVEPLSERLVALVASEYLRSRMGEAGRKHVAADFSIETFASRTADAYLAAMAIHRERTAS